MYIEVIDETVKNTKIRHAFDLSHTSSAAAEVILRRMSDEGDPERHSEGAEGPRGR
jgi:hypothetical protein